MFKPRPLWGVSNRKLQLLSLNLKSQPDPVFGICHHMDWELSRESRKLFIAWPNFSGNLSYPVPSDVGAGPAYSHAIDEGTLWSKSSLYGRMRHDLYKFMRQEVEFEIELRKLPWYQRIGKVWERM